MEANTIEKAVTDNTAIKAEVEKFLLNRGLVRVDDRDITGVNANYEFHIFLGKRGISVTMIDRATVEADEAFVAYNDEAFANLAGILSR